METQVITIQSENFTAPAPFTAGHVLNEAEASVLNQTFAENLRNNFAARMKRRQEENDDLKKAGKPLLPVYTQADFDKYAAEYKFGVRVAAARVDPVIAQARLYAGAALMKQLKAKKIDRKSISDENWDKLVADALAKYPLFTEQARKTVEAKQAAVAAIGAAGIEV